MSAIYSQMFPPAPTFTETNLPSQKGKVFIVTGGASGVGLELCAMLYKAGGKVYMAGRSEVNAKNAIENIKSGVTSIPSAGRIEFLKLQLEDLSTIKASVETFKSKEVKLDVLWNNAGVSLPPEGSKSIQGYELQLATNCLGPLLFTKLLLPCLRSAAQDSLPASTRIVWTFSQIVELSSPIGGFTMDEVNPSIGDQQKNYCISKLGNWFLASELAPSLEADGILSITQNPGNLKTNLLRHRKWMKIASYPLLYKPKFGAYTELYSGLSPELTLSQNGGLVIPWGRIHPSPRSDFVEALKSVANGGTGRAAEFYEWCEDKIARFL